MKYIYIILTLSLLISCGEEELTIYDGNQVGLDVASTNLSFLAAGTNQPVESGISVQLIAQPRSSATNVSYEISSESTAIEGLHYSIGGASVSIPAGENTALVPISILVDNFGAGESVTLGLKVTGGDNVEPAAYSSEATFSITVLCSSDLAGTYNVTSVAQAASWGCTATFTGTARWDKVGDSGYQVYLIGDAGEILDMSYGAYLPCYGYTVDPASQGNMPNGDVLLNDECNKLFYSGSSQWGEVYSINSVEVSGADLIIDWTNDYGEAAITTFSKTDGSSWPKLSKK